MLRSVDPNLITEVENWTGIKLLDNEKSYQDSQQFQLGILLLQVQQVDQFKERGWQPDLVAGHSLGVFGAAYAANVISKEDVFKLVALRAGLMQDACYEEYGMGVIVGLSRQEAACLVQQVFMPSEPVYLANQNAELQNTLSGKISGIKKVLSLAKDRAASTAKLLHVPNPSHSPLMQKVAIKLAAQIKQIDLKTPTCVYLANNNGHPVKDITNISYDLAYNCVHPVFWEQ